MKKLKNINNKLISFYSILSIVLLWFSLTHLGIIDKFMLPPPEDVLFRLFDDIPIMMPFMLFTLVEALLGLLIGVVLAIVFSFLMDGWKTIKKILEPIFLYSQTVPYFVLIPIFVMWLGFGMKPTILIVVLVCFFPITLNLLKALESVPKDLLTLFESMGASKIRIILLLKFPYILPSLISGLKISASYSVMGACIGEWMGGGKGIGLFLVRARHSYDYELVIATTILISLASSMIYYIVEVLGKKYAWWGMGSKY